MNETTLKPLFKVPFTPYYICKIGIKSEQKTKMYIVVATQIFEHGEFFWNIIGLSRTK